MVRPLTERLHPAAKGLDDLSPVDLAGVLADAQIEAATAVRAAVPAIAAASSAMAETIRRGGVLHYIAAGSSGLMAAADAMELGGTFSIPSAQLRIHMAGGLPRGVEMPGGVEDDLAGLDAALSSLSSKDTVIAVSASGTTPYTVAAARIARAADTAVVGLANNPGSTLLDLATHPVLLPTPPEVVSGSTRMGAGTAQKIALNMLSTMMAIALGHVHDGMMVSVCADNLKLRARAQSIVREISGADETTAARALDSAEGHVKAAVLIAARGVSAGRASALLGESNGNLRAALARQIEE